jgi:hypothetical protein
MFYLSLLLESMKPFTQDILKATLKTLLDSYQIIEILLLDNTELPSALPTHLPLFLQEEYQTIRTELLAMNTNPAMLRDKILAVLQKNKAQLTQQLLELETQDGFEDSNFYL